MFGVASFQTAGEVGDLCSLVYPLLYLNTLELYQTHHFEESYKHQYKRATLRKKRRGGVSFESVSVSAGGRGNNSLNNSHHIISARHRRVMLRAVIYANHRIWAAPSVIVSSQILFCHVRAKTGSWTWWICDYYMRYTCVLAFWAQQDLVCSAALVSE